MKLSAALQVLSAWGAIAFHVQAGHRSKERIVVPALSENVPVGVKAVTLKDFSRLNPFSNDTQHREIMISVFYPAEEKRQLDALPDQYMIGSSKDTTTPYMPPATATIYNEYFTEFGVPKGSFERLVTRCQLGAPILPQRSRYPMLVFSPGGGVSRLLYTVILEELARRGFVTVAIDHPYDATVVEFPDGRVIESTGPNHSSIDLFVSTRARDISFMIDEMSSLTNSLHRFVNTSHVIAFGHSLGGAAVAEAMLNDTRVRGGINLDGRLFGSMEKPNVTLSKPFLQFGSEKSSDDLFWRWDDAWQRLLGWKLQLKARGAGHAAFSDWPLLAETLDFRGKLGKEERELFGNLTSLRGLQITVDYVEAFANFVLIEKRDDLLRNNGSASFPEVEVTRYG